MGGVKSRLNAFIDSFIEVMLIIDAIFYASAQVIAEMYVNAWANSFQQSDSAIAVGFGVFISLMFIGGCGLLINLWSNIAKFLARPTYGPTFKQHQPASAFQLFYRLILAAVRNSLIFWLQVHLVGQMILRFSLE